MNSAENMLFAKSIRNLREEAGMTLEQVAQRTGFAKSHVWELEQGKGRDLTVRAVRAMAHCFGVPTISLIEETDAETRLHPEAMRVAIQIDEAFRRASQEPQG